MAPFIGRVKLFPGRSMATALPWYVRRVGRWKLEVSVGSPFPTAASSPAPDTTKCTCTSAFGTRMPLLSTISTVT
eukprot:TRINITY_DN6181_c0_g1_i1.p2 TRINITY_DN6181_c0_g1~~TRINITY_DN6181_c0_g1_i1.p2  ORF type:complete len:75 (-),score=1.01 TRINITY_DN6181_c0_g1_i1:67-291(-)